MTPRDATTEDEGKFVGLTDGAIGVQESLLQGIDGGTTTEEQIVAVLHLGKKTLGVEYRRAFSPRK